MSYTVLARRYRSATFDQIVGQEHIARTLKRAIDSDRIAHAFLFCGTRGTGKTSTARILAKSLNCEKSKGPTPDPCGLCESCQGIARGDDIDVIEIDAASHTGVENVRDIIENAQYRPARSRFKIYIIDEVHMLSKNAFNALLKIMEEPPGHVKFILATTEPEKVLPTILSRCQRYDFRNIPTREIAAHLKSICKSEKIDAAEDALLLIAKAGAGSMRDALSLLDRLLSLGEKKLSVETIEQLLGMPRSQLVFELAQAIGEGDVKQTLARADAMIQSGLSADALVASLTDHFRNLLILNTCGPESNLVEVPGLDPKELAAQAQRFDPVVLTQDITILEELRRHLRQSQAGRALIDATLVRLALAEQFTSVSELLARVDGGNGAPAQKKKPEVMVRTATPQQVQGFIRGTASQPIEPAAEAVGSLAPNRSLSDSADDLPAVGKVWEGPKRSLSSIFAASRPPQNPPPVELAAARSDNFDPVSADDADGVWSRLLNAMRDQSMALHGVLSQGRLGGIEDGVAVIRVPGDHLARLLERNGKKELLRDVISGIVGQNVGVKFEVDAAVTQVAPAPAAARSTGGAPRSVPAPAPTAPAGPAPLRLSQEEIAQLCQDPLVQALMNELGATFVKVTEE